MMSLSTTMNSVAANNRKRAKRQRVHNAVLWVLDLMRRQGYGEKEASDYAERVFDYDALAAARDAVWTVVEKEFAMKDRPSLAKEEDEEDATDVESKNSTGSCQARVLLSDILRGMKAARQLPYIRYGQFGHM